MLPMNATPLNERLIRVLIEEHQMEIRRCFALRPDSGRATPATRLLNLIVRWRRTGEPPSPKEIGAVIAHPKPDHVSDSGNPKR